MKKDKISIFTDKHINFTVDIPETEQERHTGLTYLKKIPKNFGMLYYIPERVTASFYTKDTPWSVDYIFIGWFGDIIKISTAQPFSIETHTAPNTFAVLELKGGECKRLGIQVGDTVFYSNTKLTKNNEHIFHGHLFKKINHRNYDIVDYNNLYFVAFASGGAMGWAGTMQFITKEDKKIDAYTIDYTLLDFDVAKIFPPLTFSYWGDDKKEHPEWKWIPMGFGNQLFVRKGLYDRFIKEIGPTNVKNLGYVYGHWVNAAYKILKSDRMKGKTK